MSTAHRRPVLPDTHGDFRFHVSAVSGVAWKDMQHLKWQLAVQATFQSQTRSTGGKCHRVSAF